MPPGIHSRYLFCTGLTDEEGRVYLSERVPFRFLKQSDNRIHTVVDGDTLFTLAHSYFNTLDRPSGLWWVIADFQPEPIIDGTLKLTIGRVLVIPSVRFVIDTIFNESRRDEFGA